jgi:transcriptional regulator with XRE-family HTH domain
MKNIHIGEMIKQKRKENGMTVTAFAKAIHRTRTDAYSIFKRESIDIELLTKISEVLNYDFVAKYSPQQETYLVIVEVDEQKLNKLKSFLGDISLILVKKIVK